MKEVQLDGLSEEEFDEDFGDSASIKATLGTNSNEIAGTRMDVDSECTYSSLAEGGKRGPQVSYSSFTTEEEYQSNYDR